MLTTKAIESRVARIKARVAELTKELQPKATTLKHAQYEDRSPSRSPRGQSDNRRGSQRHHYYDSENEHHEAAYSPHQGRRLSKTHGSRSPSPDYDSEFEEKMKKLEELEEKEKEDNALEKHEEENPHQGRRLSKTRRSRSLSQYHDYEFERKMKRLEELEAKEKEDREREKYEVEPLMKEVKKTMERAKRKEERDLMEKAIEDYDRKQKGEQEKKVADEEFRERVKKTFGQAGYDEESIDEILKKGEKEKEHGHGKEIKISDLRRPTYIKVHRKHMSPETLEWYNLPWHWNEVNSVLRCRLSKCRDR